MRAALTDVGRWRSNRRPVGASTITQQVAKNMLLTNELSISRKVREILLATRIEQALSKDRILELYLNEIYLGSGAYGVAAAALTYFNKSLDELTLERGGLSRRPAEGAEQLPSDRACRRRPRRGATGCSTACSRTATRPTAEVAAAKAEPLAVRRREEAEIVTAPYFAEEVRRELAARYGEKALYQGGLSVRTSLDPRLQAAADKALRNGLIAYDRKQGGWRGAVGQIDPGPNWPTRLDADSGAGRRRHGRLAARGRIAHRGRRRDDRAEGRRDRPHPVRRDALGPAVARRRQSRRRLRASRPMSSSPATSCWSRRCPRSRQRPRR